MLSYRDKLVLDVAAELAGGQRVPGDTEGNGGAEEEEGGAVETHLAGIALLAGRALSPAATSEVEL